MKWFLLIAAVVTSFQHLAAQIDTNTISIRPGLPSFLRQGDHTELTAKIQNHSDQEITGQIQLELIDGARKQSVDGWFLNTFPNQYFTVAPGQSEEAKFPVQVPMQYSNSLLWKISVAWDSSRVHSTGSITILAGKDNAGEKRTAKKDFSLHVTKKILLVKSTASGRKTTPVEDQIALMVGDTIEVQLGLQVQEVFKQLHIEDGLAAGTKLLAGSAKTSTAGYEQKTNGESVNFFFKQVKKGSLTLRYLLAVTTAGNFSTGSTTAELNGARGQQTVCPPQRLNIE